jgi:aryl-alcohol dehydrogenase-like predicted oxidoreductase
MRKWKMPITDWWISGIVMGTGNFCRNTEAEALRLMDHFAEHDGNLLDTAHTYCKLRPEDQNVAEQIVGRWLRESSQASDMLISTKGGHKLSDDFAPASISLGEIETELDHSLATLGRETIDLYYLHRDDPSQPVEALLDILRDFRRKGKIRYFGLSNWSTDRIREAIALEKQARDRGLVAIQNRWSLVRYNDEAASDPHLVAMDWQAWDLFKQEQLTVMPYSSLGKGYFSKYLQNTCEMTEKLRRYYENDLNKKRAEVLRQMHKETGYSISQLVLAWLMHQPLPVYPVAAFRRSDQLHDAVGAAAINLSYEMMERLGADEPW